MRYDEMNEAEKFDKYQDGKGRGCTPHMHVHMRMLMHMHMCMCMHIHSSLRLLQHTLLLRAEHCTLHTACSGLTSYILHPTSYIPHPTSYILHLTPYTLHPTPFNQHLHPRQLDGDTGSQG